MVEALVSTDSEYIQMNTIHGKVMRFIGLITGVDQYNSDDIPHTAKPIIQEVFTRGNCGNFAIILHDFFGGEMYIDEQAYHVITKIDGIFYDVNGVWTNDDPDYTPIPVTTKELEERDLINNYSFTFRGPII